MTRLLAALAIALVVLGPAMARPRGAQLEQALERAIQQGAQERAIQQGALERAIQQGARERASQQGAQEYEEAQRFLSAYLERGVQHAGQQDRAQTQQGALLATQLGLQLLPAIPGIIEAISNAAG
jgi:hypothetical protein